MNNTTIDEYISELYIRYLYFDADSKKSRYSVEKDYFMI